MRILKPRWDSNAPPLKPSNDAQIRSQNVDMIPGDPVIATQIWMEPDGTEFALELMMDNDMKSGLVMSCSVNSALPDMMTGLKSGSGVLPIAMSGLSGPPVTEREKPPEVAPPADPIEKGTDYDFEDTGFVKKK